MIQGTYIHTVHAPKTLLKKFLSVFQAVCWGPFTIMWAVSLRNIGKNSSEAIATVCMWWMKNLRWSTASGTSYATHKDREKSLTWVGIERPTSALNHRCSTEFFWVLLSSFQYFSTERGSKLSTPFLPSQPWYTTEDRPQHQELHALLFATSVQVLLRPTGLWTLKGC